MMQTIGRRRTGSGASLLRRLLAPGAWRLGGADRIEPGHLVRVSDLAPGHLRPLGEIRGEVTERWPEERQRENEERYFASRFTKKPAVPEASVRGLVDPLIGQAGATP